jgi:hypothetical protein
LARQQIARPRSLPLPSLSTTPMGDITFILISIAFFVIAVAYVYGCEKLR